MIMSQNYCGFCVPCADYGMYKERFIPLTAVESFTVDRDGYWELHTNQEGKSYRFGSLYDGTPNIPVIKTFEEYRSKVVNTTRRI